jgi:hypothetical protein
VCGPRSGPAGVALTSSRARSFPNAWGPDRVKEAVMDTLQAAREDFADVMELTRELVRFPAATGSTL